MNPCAPSTPSLFCVCVCVCCRQHSDTQGVLRQHGSGLVGEETTLRGKVPASQSAAGPKELGPRHPAARLHGLPAREVHHGEGEGEWVILPVSAGMWCVCDCDFSCPRSSTGGITAAGAAAWCATPARSAGWPWRAGPATRSECATSVTPTSTQSKWEGAEGGGTDTGG